MFRLHDNRVTDLTLASGVTFSGLATEDPEQLPSDFTSESVVIQRHRIFSTA